MTEEQVFLSAITASPDDHTARLAYADWLQDNDDPRAEIVRLRVRVATLHDGWPEARDRLVDLERDAPAKWLALLDGPVWCITGNIVESRPFGPGAVETRRGTKLFKPNAKVHLADVRHAHLVLTAASELTVHDHLRVVGRHRKSVDWICCLTRAQHITNWRVELVYQPGALAKLRREGWPGFNLRRGAFTCPQDKTCPGAIRELLALL